MVWKGIPGILKLVLIFFCAVDSSKISNAKSSRNIYQCCAFIFSHPQSLMTCIHDTSHSTLVPLISASTPYLHGQQGPKLMLLLISRATHHIVNYSAYSSSMQAMYAHSHGYGYYLSHQEYNKLDDYVYCPKLRLILDLWDIEASHADYVVWLDSDFVILNMSYRLEQLSASYPDAHIIMSRDVSNIANSGAILIRRSKWSRDFIQEWLSARLLHDNSELTDQQGFEFVYRSRLLEEMKAKIKIVAINEFNSAAPPMQKQLPTDQFLHLAAESSSLRRSVFQRGLQTLCSILNSSNHQLATKFRNWRPGHRIDWSIIPVPTQLSLAQEDILELSIKVYFGELSRLEATLDWDSINADSLAAYRQVVSKYCHALVYRNKNVETNHTLEIRRKAFSLAKGATVRQYEILKSLDQCANCLRSHCIDTVVNSTVLARCVKCQHECSKVNNSCEHSCIQNVKQNLLNSFPETAKLSCELAFELLVVSEVKEERLQLAMYIDLILDTILPFTNENQHGMLMHMKSSLFRTLGDIDYYQGEYEAAGSWLRRSLHVQEQMQQLNYFAWMSHDGWCATLLSLGRSLCATANLGSGELILKELLSPEQGGCFVTFSIEQQGLIHDDIARCRGQKSELQLMQYPSSSFRITSPTV